ncbi:MAG TPA: hypothetical protein VK176_16335 [Phycisphaerales bacterium]|nr:hypothetical protein [Phycisphaerales bacterium]
MSNVRTCFIVGAGASAPYKFPLGSELVEQIVSLKLTQENQNAKGGVDRIGLLFEMIEDLNRARPDSIDQYIKNARDQYRDVAAWAVSICLAVASESSPISFGVQGDWVRFIINRHVDDILRTGSCDISFVTFNYDTYIERAVGTMLSGYPTTHSFSELVDSVKCIHLHGCLGKVKVRDLYAEPAESKPSMFENVSERAMRIAEKYYESLRFYWEKPEQFEAQDRARHILNGAERIVVLGIGQAIEPLRNLLSGCSSSTRGAEYFATSFGLTDVQTRRLESAFWGAGRCTIKPVKALELLQHHVYT